MALALSMLVLLVVFAVVVGLALWWLTRSSRSSDSKAAALQHAEQQWALVVAGLGLTRTGPWTAHGERHGVPVAVLRIPPLHLPGQPPRWRTELTAAFGPESPPPFRAHQRGPVVLGGTIPTGDAPFDAGVVLRSEHGPALLRWFGPQARAAIVRYVQLTGTLELSEQGIRTMYTDPMPPAEMLHAVLDAQCHVLWAVRSGR